MNTSTVTSGNAGGEVKGMDQALLVLRLTLAALFLIAGVRKLMGFAGTAGYFGSLGLPMPEVTTALVIIIEIAGAVALLVGFLFKPGAMLLLVFTVGATIIGHPFWSDMGQLNNFLKNLIIIGSLYVLWVTGPGRMAMGR